MLHHTGGGGAHTGRVTEDSSQRSILPADVAEAVDSIRKELGPDADVDAVVAALRARNLGFLKAIMGLRAIKGTPLGDAKWRVRVARVYRGQ